MNYVKLFVLVAMVSLQSPAQAMDWAELRKATEGVANGERQQVLFQRLNEMVLMLVVYTRYQHEQYPEAMLFCPPKGHPFHLKDLLELISTQAKLDKAEDSTPVQKLLLDGFRREFPCPVS